MSTRSRWLRCDPPTALDRIEEPFDFVASLVISASISHSLHLRFSGALCELKQESQLS